MLVATACTDDDEISSEAASADTAAPVETEDASDSVTAPTTDPDVEPEPTDDDDCDVPVETDQDLDRATCRRPSCLS